MKKATSCLYCKMMDLGVIVHPVSHLSGNLRPPSYDRSCNARFSPVAFPHRRANPASAFAGWRPAGPVDSGQRRIPGAPPRPCAARTRKPCRRLDATLCWHHAGRGRCRGDARRMCITRPTRRLRLFARLGWSMGRRRLRPDRLEFSDLPEPAARRGTEADTARANRDWRNVGNAQSAAAFRQPSGAEPASACGIE